ncbi:hypothetical protein D9619_006822 [Psilocybe cf. subviscida]|uniref:Methyltransferase domain-containing protein n=1 Tax=Psilocybe cf. subviscida TaxID=2480587 RepID=A0A8H5B559_9AGAR|nr:hypothetical protein D9619_006822 [Psilocybe cf. subviscida]
MAMAVMTQQSNSSIQKLGVAEAYDICAEAYMTLFSMNPSTTRSNWTNGLASSLAPGSQVLEIGCGSGLMTVPFIEQGCEVTAVDISAAQIALAQKLIPSATLMHSDMMALEFEPESFDAVSAIYAIPHLPLEEQGVMLERSAGWLKPGGVLVLNFPAEVSQEKDDIIDFLGMHMYWKSTGVEGTRKLMEEHAMGLRVVQEELAGDPLPEDHENGLSNGGIDMFHWIKAVKEGAPGKN